MTVFFLFAALMLAAALFFVLPPLLSKSQGAHVERDAINLDILRDQLRELDADRTAGTIDSSSYESARHDLEQRVAEEIRPGAASSSASVAGKPWTAMVVGLLVPIVAGALYFGLGNRDALNPVNLVAVPQQSYSPEQIDALVNKIAQHMKDNPDDAKGWSILAQTYAKLGRFAEAADAYSHLVKLTPNDADMLAAYANALGLSNNRSLQGEPEKLINRALAIDGKNIGALALSGAVNYERHDYTAAVTQWRKILTLVPPNSDAAHSITTNIDQALSLSGMPADNQAKPAGASVAAGASSTAAGTTASTVITGHVELDPALRAKAADGDTVFIFARAVDGPPMPLAVLRKQVKDLPLNFALDDSMSMMPSAKLSSFPNVVVTARISKSGSPMPGPGDLEGGSGTTHPGAQGLKIIINTPSK